MAGMSESHTNFAEVTKFSFWKIKVGHLDSNIPIVITDIKHRSKLLNWENREKSTAQKEDDFGGF